MKKKKSAADPPWYEKDLPWNEEELLWGFYEASVEFKHLPLLGQIRSLEALARYLRGRAPQELLEPLESIYTDLMNQAAALTSHEKPGPRPAPLSEKIVGARAAGTVTVLKRCCGWKVGEAIKKVSEVTGIETEWLRYFRDEIHRGRADEGVRKIYDTHVKDFSRITEMTRDDVASYVLDVCAKYYAPGRPFRRLFDL
jgi:hypothetical protein